jgi:hypothetical protein
MTRFGFGPGEWARTAELMRAVIADGADVRREVNELRAGFTHLGYCFDEADYRDELARLRALL